VEGKLVEVKARWVADTNDLSATFSLLNKKHQERLDLWKGLAPAVPGRDNVTVAADFSQKQATLDTWWEKQQESISAQVNAWTAELAQLLVELTAAAERERVEAEMAIVQMENELDAWWEKQQHSIEAQLAIWHADVVQLESRLVYAGTQAKRRIEADIARLCQKCLKWQEKRRESIDARLDDWYERTERLEARMARATPEEQANLAARIDELDNKYDTWFEKRYTVHLPAKAVV
jgi:hypothetical protein